MCRSYVISIRVWGGGRRCSIVLRFEMAFCRDFFPFLSFFSGRRKKDHPGLLADVHTSKHTVLEAWSNFPE